VSANANALHTINPARAGERFVVFIICSHFDDFVVMPMGRCCWEIIQEPRATIPANKSNKPAGFSNRNCRRAARADARPTEGRL
jgi:hypothetical protein